MKQIYIKFKRIIFYLTVIESNRNKVLILEEPETHSFPPYTSSLAERIAADQSNQYFITTHSPYLLHNIIENTDYKDFNLVITYFDNYETKAHIVSYPQIRQMLNDYTDVFFNFDKYLSDNE